MMHRDMIDEMIERKTKELKLYRRHYRQSGSMSQKDAADHVERCIESLKRLRRKAPPTRRYVTLEPVKEPITLEELLQSFAGNVPQFNK